MAYPDFFGVDFRGVGDKAAMARTVNFHNNLLHSSGSSAPIEVLQSVLSIIRESPLSLVQWGCHEGFAAPHDPRRRDAAPGPVASLHLFPQRRVRGLQANGGSRFLRCSDRRLPGPS